MPGPVNRKQKMADRGEKRFLAVSPLQILLKP
jgi:hypothetical protein